MSDNDIGKTVRIISSKSVSHNEVGTIIDYASDHQEGTEKVWINRHWDYKSEEWVDGAWWRRAVIRPYHVEIPNGNYPIRHWYAWRELQE